MFDMLRMQLNSISLNVLETAAAQNVCQKGQNVRNAGEVMITTPYCCLTPGLMNKIQLVLLNNKD